MQKQICLCAYVKKTDQNVIYLTIFDGYFTYQTSESINLFKNGTCQGRRTDSRISLHHAAKDLRYDTTSTGAPLQ
jgi:hypothetical protein